MMIGNLDINKEYEKIFGVETRESLYRADDMEYVAFRQSILESKRESDLKKSLPFEGVKILSYEDYKRDEIVRETEKKGIRIFYIKRYDEHKLIKYAAGYFNAKNAHFVVLDGAFFHSTDYFIHLLDHFTIYDRTKLSHNFLDDNGVLTQKEKWSYKSASLAASLILGEKSTFREWKDENGLTLDTYFPKYKSKSIDKFEDETFPDYIPPESLQITNNPIALTNNKSDNKSSSVPNTNGEIFSKSSFSKNNQHIFYLVPTTTSISKYWASGYYDNIQRKFYIRKNSVLNFDVSPIYAFSQANTRRLNIINEYCKVSDNGYLVLNEIECETPTAAAFYVIGYPADGWIFWVDSNKKNLQEIYRNFDDII